VTVTGEPTDDLTALGQRLAAIGSDIGLPAPMLQSWDGSATVFSWAELHDGTLHEVYLRVPEPDEPASAPEAGARVFDTSTGETVWARRAAVHVALRPIESTSDVASVLKALWAALKYHSTTPADLASFEDLRERLLRGRATGS
jgi:hypothetical protein